MDVVINSLKGDLLRESLDCVAQFGSFVEIAKDDILSKNSRQPRAAGARHHHFCFRLD